MTMQMIVVGGGYGGVSLVRRLEALGLGHQVTLIDRNASHTVLTEIHQVAAGLELPETYQIPFADMGSFRFLQAEVTGLDSAAGQLLTTAGPVHYDLLVFAVGGIDADFGVPGVREHALTLHSLTEALTIRNRLEELPAGTPILIAGGGFTGVELAAELGERYGGGENITLVEGAPAILPGLPRRLQRRARRRLGALGVNVITGQFITRVDGPAAAGEGGMAHFADGSALPFGLLVWACGVRANPLIARLGIPVDKAGRAVVGPNLETPLPGVFVIGDAAAGAPPTAQAASQQGAALALHLAARAAGRTAPVRPVRLLGALVALGHGYGAGVVTGLPLTGWVPALIKRVNVARWFRTAGGWAMALRYFLGFAPGARRLTRPTPGHE
ncbi:MAG TPA: FAD-dependent oxidoreductase [Symbiobacteriaceae bacterium]|nr:FAD-dependent oxidoreductase [Symbiobacteriaceae bacterium]